MASTSSMYHRHYMNMPDPFFLFSWEYPNHQGIGCNIINSNDTANFLSFLQALRADPTGAKITISAAVYITTFVGSDNNPSTNVSGFATVLDYITMMDYDVWGSWSSAVGPNAPLNDSCAPSSDQQGSAVSGVTAWTNAGMPADKIVLAVAAYGHSYSVNSSDAFLPGTQMLAPYPAFNKSNQPLGDAWDNTGSVDACGVYQPQGGTFRFWGLVNGSFLTTQGTAAPGIFYRLDSCSQTVRRPSTRCHYCFKNLLLALCLQRNIPSHDFLRRRSFVHGQGHVHQK